MEPINSDQTILPPTNGGSVSDALAQATKVGRELVLPVADVFDIGYRAISIVENAQKSWSSLREAIREYKAGDSDRVGRALIKTAVAVSLVAAFIFWFQAAHIANVSIGLYDTIYALALNAIDHNHISTPDLLVNGVVCLAYLLAEVLVGPAAKLATSLVITGGDAWKARKHFRDDKELLGVAYVTRTMIRIHNGHRLPLQAYQSFRAV